MRGRDRGFPGGASGKEPAASARDGSGVVLIPGSRRSLEEDMATHSSILTRRIPWTEEPRGLQSLRLQRRTQLRQHSTHAQEVICCPQ